MRVWKYSFWGKKMIETPVKRKPGRPPKVRAPQTGPAPLLAAPLLAAPLLAAQEIKGVAEAEVEAEAEAVKYGEAHFTPELVARIRECNDIHIVCKVVNDKGVTVNHSRHDAIWLKEYGSCIPRVLSTA